MLKKQELIDEEKSMLRNVYVEKAWTLIRNNIKGKTLDLGCGNGFVTHVHSDVVGLDANMMDCFIPYVLGDARALPFRSEVFDTIVLSHLLEHFATHDEILRECGRVLKRGGRIIVSVPNVDAFTARVFGRRYGYVFNPKDHLYHFNFPRLRDILSPYLTIIQASGTTPTFPYADYLMNLRPLRGMWWWLGDLLWRQARDLIVIAEKR